MKDQEPPKKNYRVEHLTQQVTTSNKFKMDSLGLGFLKCRLRLMLKPRQNKKGQKFVGMLVFCCLFFAAGRRSKFKKKNTQIKKKLK